MAWNKLIEVNARGEGAAIFVALVLVVVETLVDAPLAANACRFAGRALRSAWEI